VKAAFVNATRALKAEHDATNNATLREILKNQFWCLRVANGVRRMGACLPACRRRGGDGKIGNGDETDDDIGGSRTDALAFCEGDMGDVNAVFPGLNNQRSNLQDLFVDRNCSAKPTCQQLVDEGLELALAQYQLDQLGGAVDKFVSSAVFAALLAAVVILF
jgi:hypothetical protein